MPLKRLKTKITLENLWLYILTLLREKPLYAYEIRDRIEERFRFGIGNMTAYLVLYRLESEDYVKTEWKIVDGRQRKYYAITEKGRKVLDEGICFLEALVRELKSG